MYRNFYSDLVKSKLSGVLFVLEVLALSSFVWQKAIHISTARSANPFFLSLILFLSLALFLGSFMGLILKLYISLIQEKTRGISFPVTRFVILSFSPLLLLFLFYLEYTAFLMDIRPYLLPLASGGSLYLNLAFICKLKKLRSSPFFSPEKKNSLRLKEKVSRRLPVLLFACSFFLYSLFASGLISTPLPLTGDEPHYLLISESLLHEGDINLYDNYQKKDFLKFYPGEIESHAYPGQKGEKYLYSKHFPGLSVLLLPAYYLGEKAGQFISDVCQNPELKRKTFLFFVRLPLCLLTALASVLFFLLALDLWQDRRAALLSWLAFAFTSPMIFYSQALYPEVPAALILLFLFRQGIYKRDSRTFSLLALGSGLALLPWLGMKYILHAAVFFIILSLVFLSSLKKRLTKIFLFLAPLFISWGLYLFFLWNLYGKLSPLTIYKGTISDSEYKLAGFLVSNLPQFVLRLLGALLDQRTGIIAYSPVYILCAAGFFLLLKKKRKEASLLFLIFSSYLIFFALLKFWGGHAPPARHFIPVLWAPALWTTAAFQTKSKCLSLLTNVFLALSFLIAAAGLRNPELLYYKNLPVPSSAEEMTSKLLASLSNSFIDLRRMVPSLVNQPTVDWLPLAAWMAGILLITFLFLKKRKPEVLEASELSLKLRPAFFLGLSLLFLGYVFFDIKFERRQFFEAQNYELFFQDENSYGRELDGFWTKGGSNTALLIRTPCKLKALELTLSSPVAVKAEIRVDRYKYKERIRFQKTLVVQAPLGFPWKGGYLYSLHIQNSSGFFPYKIDRSSTDGRFLGLFLKIKPLI